MSRIWGWSGYKQYHALDLKDRTRIGIGEQEAIKDKSGMRTDLRNTSKWWLTLQAEVDAGAPVYFLPSHSKIL